MNNEQLMLKFKDLFNHAHEPVTKSGLIILHGIQTDTVRDCEFITFFGINTKVVIGHSIHTGLITVGRNEGPITKLYDHSTAIHLLDYSYHFLLNVLKTKGAFEQVLLKLQDEYKHN